MESRCRSTRPPRSPGRSSGRRWTSKLMVQGADRIAPDSAAPRFIEALNEAASRIDKEKGNYFPVVVILGSMSAEGSSFNERDRPAHAAAVRGAARPCTSSCCQHGAQSATGANQTAVGDAAAKNTGGRYENIAAATRLATLLPEIGAQIAKSSRAPEPSVSPDISTSKRRVGRHGADRRANPHRVELRL